MKIFAPKFRLPNDTQRSVVIGRTGSGKTMAGLWQLSERSYDTMPWIIFDFKLDNSIARIPKTQMLKLGTLPKTPGLYIVQPVPEVDDDAVTEMLWQIWSAENIGIFIDEGYMIGNRNPALQAILTQGRSKHIPLVILTQRPTFISRFVFSEADFIQLFALTDERDRKTVQAFIPRDQYDTDLKLDLYNSIWYDVAADYVWRMRPVPPLEQILARFNARLPDTPRKLI